VSARKYLAGLAAIAYVMASPALAADMPVWSKSAPPRYMPIGVSPVYSWTGCYFGVEGGGGWGQSQHTAANSPNPTGDGLPITNINVGGGLVGGTVGCNYQVSSIVFGIENDMSWTNIKGTSFDLRPFTPTATATTSEKWLDTLRGRVGYAWDRYLIYATGGAAFANVDVNACGPAGFCASDSQTRTGWTAGAGGEWAAIVNQRWSMTLKIEYLHVDLGTGQFINPPVVTPGGLTLVTRNARTTNDVVRAGINWKFDVWAPPTLSPEY
jgi:outer membrane immunogenic protein